MASQLTQTLTKLSSLSSFLPKLSSLSSRNLFSHKSHLIEIDLDSASSSSSPSSSEVVAGIQRLEDAIHSIIVRRLEPDWLAFRPGSSYWVPPSRSFADKLAKLVGKMSNPLTQEESLSLVSSHGWPSSSYFLNQEIQLDSSTCSGWVPPSCTVTDNHVQLVGKLTDTLTEEESLSLFYAHGWPSSSYFLDQGSPPMVEVHVYSQSSENAPFAEDEE